MVSRTIRGVLVLSAFFLFSTAGAAEYSSIQLVGNFAGIPCEPDDPANDMEYLGDHQWRKLKLINEPGEPDTIDFKFTAEGSYMPMHWGWSHVDGWGVAKYDWSPPSIVAILPEDGYWYFNFNDTTRVYSLERPDAAIEGRVRSDRPTGVPEGTCISLYSGADGLVESCVSFGDSLFSFDDLPAGEFSVTAAAPGYRDTTITSIITSEGSAEWVEIALVPVTAVQVTMADCERVSGGVLLTWTAYCCGNETGFEVYRNDTDDLGSAVRITPEPVYGVFDFSYLDECAEPQKDRYYWLVETGTDDPAVVGPLLAEGIPGMPGSLGQNYPNPFNPATTIPFSIGSPGAGSRVVLSFFDVSGRTVARYDLGVKPAGDHEFVWNPVLSSGTGVPSGVYYCRLQIGKEVYTRKMVLLR